MTARELTAAMRRMLERTRRSTVVRVRPNQRRRRATAAESLPDPP
jgi:hypothetical protein